VGDGQDWNAVAVTAVSLGVFAVSYLLFAAATRASERNREGATS
jgi:hypothetical protein